MFITDKKMDVLCHQLMKISEMYNNYYSVTHCKTHYMIFTPRNRLIDGFDVTIHDVKTERVYAT